MRRVREEGGDWTVEERKRRGAGEDEVNKSNRSDKMSSCQYSISTSLNTHSMISTNSSQSNQNKPVKTIKVKTN